MENFENLRQALVAARLNKKQARKAQFVARERVKRIRQQQTVLARTYSQKVPEHRDRAADLLWLIDDAETASEKADAEYQQAIAREKEAFARFMPLSDPGEQVRHLSAEYPFLLLPVRLETRFKTVTKIDGTLQDKFWVRVFPDDCAIDCFEDTLSEGEVWSVRTYWMERWRAGGVEAQKRAAWRGLVANHGSGRACWMQQQYRPVNATQEPAKPNPNDIVLVIPFETPIDAWEQGKVVQYWKDVWLAHGDKNKTDKLYEDLETDVGEARAKQLVTKYKPFNLEDAPADPNQSNVPPSIAWLQFPKVENISTKQSSWSQAHRVDVLPDRFVLVGYVDSVEVLRRVGEPIETPLFVGPDPSAEGERQFRHEGGELSVGEDLLWLFDFHVAVAKGMGFDIDLTPEQAARGFDRLLVLGVRLSADHDDGQSLVETLLQHHQWSRPGFSLVPQGTPTNNTEGGGAGFGRTDDADASYDDYFLKDALFSLEHDWLAKQDGQWLAECLGIDPAILTNVRHSGGTDQADARAMNIALWPATFGYFMNTMMWPMFDQEHVVNARWFFTNFVSGRGSIPAVRIGRQPYGILPVTSFSKQAWIDSAHLPGIAGLQPPELFNDFLPGLNKVLLKLDREWARKSDEVSHVGKQGDAHQILLDVLGLHPTSVEFHQRYSESLEHLFNLANLQGLGDLFESEVAAVQQLEDALELLAQFGYDAGVRDAVRRGDNFHQFSGKICPDILAQFYFAEQNLLKGPLIDDRPLSETGAIRSYTTLGENYIEWLVRVASTSFEDLRQQKGFKDGKPPTALLYIMLRHALILAFWDARLDLIESARALPPTDLKKLQREPPFIDVAAQAAGQSRWKLLDFDVTEYIVNNLEELTHLGAASAILEQLKALCHLESASTARLERAFAEHIDCASYRLDAWQLGLVHYRLAAMRYYEVEEQGVKKARARQGLYLGAYGWVEDLRRATKEPTPVTLEGELKNVFQPPNARELLRDPANGGYIHAPSLDHAVTAAVLRNGYLSNATAENPKSLSVNLTSDRVRMALTVVEGIRNGQSPAALLGYQLERGLHDRHGLAEVDRFIYGLRKVFPLNANRLDATRVEDEDVPIEAIEARNVVDGFDLVNHIKQCGIKAYPFGRSDLPNATSDERTAIDIEVDRLLDTHDAVADLALAEGVHQVVRGNYDRAAATADAYGKGGFPPEPDVIRTPRSGITLTHRVALHLDTPADPPNDSSIRSVPMTPRAQAEPALNQWLSTVLPSPDSVGCKVSYFDSAQSGLKEQVVTQQDLGLEPIDLLYLLDAEGQQAMTEVDDRIVHWIYANGAPCLDAGITIHHLDEFSDTRVSFFQLAPLIRSLRALILKSRPLKASDLILATAEETLAGEEIHTDKNKSRLEDKVKGDESNPGHDSLEDLKKRVEDFRDEIDGLITNASTQDIIDRIDRDKIDGGVTDIGFIKDFSHLLATANLFGIRVGWGFAYRWKRQTSSSVLGKVDELVNRWRARLVEYDSLMDEYPAATDKMALLRKMERLVSTKIADANQSADITDLYNTIKQKRVDFENKLHTFESVLSESKTLSALINNLQAALPVSDFDFQGIDVDAIEGDVVSFANTLVDTIESLLKDDIGPRLNMADVHLQEHDSASEPATRIEALQAAAKQLLGGEFLLIPEFSFAQAQVGELQNAYASSSDLLDFQTGTLGVDHPVDDWLHGVARVNDKMHHFEQVMFLTEAFDKSAPGLTPMQLPYKANDRWAALQFRSKLDEQKFSLGGNKLLYTAHFANEFVGAKRQCGLLLDEWSEIIPGDEETTGLAVHFDRPGAEAPQSMLLVTPPGSDGAWNLQTLLDALNETLELAKKRGVEPAHLDTTPYARFLPSTMMAVTARETSISANLAFNNQPGTPMEAVHER